MERQRIAQVLVHVPRARIRQDPDVEVPRDEPRPSNDQNHGSPSRRADERLITEAECLQMVLDVLPGISVKYGLDQIQNKTADETRTVARCEELIDSLLEGPYPTEADASNRGKRKREDDESDQELYHQALDSAGGHDTYCFEAYKLLKTEFCNIPVKHIREVFGSKEQLGHAYRVLADQVQRDNGSIGVAPFKRLKQPRKGEPRPSKLENTRELQVARERADIVRDKFMKLRRLELDEEANLQQAQQRKEMGECQCCFSDFPLNRMIFCAGNDTHPFCFDCLKRYVETEIGQSRCRPVCFATEDCHEPFSRQQLKQALEEKTFDRLEHMQQQEDLAAAGLDFLSECPFCDFKMECPPVEIDKEFRCQSNKCRKTSCRLCQKETHIPLSCKEAKKDERLSLRHVIEEAMSAALIRSCNRCKHPFVKDYGCNKMTCSHCGNVQCYICSKNVVDYRHFGEGGDPNISNGRSCPLHEDVEARHVEEVQRAARATLDKVKADNPGLSDADLMIKVSEGVRRGEAGQRVHGVEGMARPRAGLEDAAAIARMHRIRELEHQLRARQEYVHPPLFHPLGAALVPFPAPPPNYLYGPPNPPAIQYPPHAIQQANQGQAMFYPPQHYYYPQYRHAHRPNQRF